MKRYALTSALVLALSTVVWGNQFTGIMAAPASPFGSQAINMIVSGPGGIQCFECNHFMHMFPVSPGCGTSQCHTWTGHWFPGGNNSTSSNANTNTSATGPSGNSVADASSHSTSGHSSSTSTSHSQSSAISGGAINGGATSTASGG